MSGVFDFSWFTDFVSWLTKELLYVPHLLFHESLTGFIAVLNAIPVPSFMSNAQGYLSQISPSVLWFAGLLHIGFGITTLISALVLRFLLRRIPFIGG